jgi:hypothetical protein
MMGTIASRHGQATLIGYIDRLHRDDWEWHYVVDSICLDTRGKGGLLVNAMHDINK